MQLLHVIMDIISGHCALSTETIKLLQHGHIFYINVSDSVGEKISSGKPTKALLLEKFFQNIIDAQSAHIKRLRQLFEGNLSAPPCGHNEKLPVQRVKTDIVEH